MTFAQTLREDILINRRSRARKARFTGRLIGFALTACLVVALRTEPQLRALVQDLALAAMGTTDSAAQVQGDAPQEENAQALETLGISDEGGGGFGSADAAPFDAGVRQSQIKVNRGISQ